MDLLGVLFIPGVVPDRETIVFPGNHESLGRGDRVIKIYAIAGTNVIIRLVCFALVLTKLWIAFVVPEHWAEP